VGVAAGIAHQEIEAAKPRAHQGHHRLDLIQGGDIAGHCQRAATFLFDRSRGDLDLGSGARGTDHRGPCLAIGDCDRRADAVPRTGHDRDLAVQ
jgi:hypothetical protein